MMAMVFLATGAAALVLLLPRSWSTRSRWKQNLGEAPRRRAEVNSVRGRRLWPVPGRAAETTTIEIMSALVRHLAALLASGRDTQIVWKDLETVLSALLPQTSSARAATQVPQLRSGARPPQPGSEHRSLLLRPARRPRTPGEYEIHRANLLVVRVASAAARIGQDPVLAIRRHLRVVEPSVRGSSWAQAWQKICLALSASSATGCSVARVLDRLAMDMDGAAESMGARETALAGPRATVKLLSALPLLGLLLALLLGTDLMAVVFGTALGTVCMVVGAVLWGISRVWTRKLIRLAEAVN